MDATAASLAVTIPPQGLPGLLRVPPLGTVILSNAPIPTTDPEGALHARP